MSWMKLEKLEALLKDMGTENDASGVRAQGVVFRAIWGKMEKAKGNKASWAYVIDLLLWLSPRLYLKRHGMMQWDCTKD